MKRILIAAFAAVVGLTVVAADAEAKRLGGGSSSGMRRDSSIMKREPAPSQSATPAPGARPNTATAPQPAQKRSWLGPLAGLAAGIGLAALFSHFGLGEGMANMVMLMLLVVAGIFVLKLLFGRRQAEPPSPMQYAGGYPQQQASAAYAPQQFGGGSGSASVPADFDSEGFLRQAKLNFVRLQAANDAGNMDDIRNFTTPELFAEVQLQYQERGRSVQQTDVVQLNADLLDVGDEGNVTIASVRFHGLLRETANGSPEPFREVWHLVRPLDGSRGWIVAGIQQDEAALV